MNGMPWFGNCLPHQKAGSNRDKRSLCFPLGKSPALCHGVCSTKHICGGSPEELVTALLDYRGLTTPELKRIRAMLDEAKASRSVPERK